MSIGDSSSSAGVKNARSTVFMGWCLIKQANATSDGSKGTIFILTILNKDIMSALHIGIQMSNIHR